MANISKLKPAGRRDTAYYRQRQKNDVFALLVEFFAKEAEQNGITKKDLAEALSKDPSQITRWLSAPSNFELDTLSDILLALGAEMQHKIVRFSEQQKPNYAHPLIAKCIGVQGPKFTIKPETAAKSAEPRISKITITAKPPAVALEG